ncbi:hypothetical protein RclHR1_01640007 [Rhizophagus clarus]|uniref:Uncharacterized protein n=1 Tax=Rhizophagus clarus TaxID=94130 RepID=A0A2Z6QIZ8_9GLOM|nr:hypothetical protein RclHR1_01640007 [Rhizophagus clarus]GES95490.1 hypothetical protein GLOIN_2v1764522 [Rhizophagus clarus]
MNFWCLVQIIYVVNSEIGVYSYHVGMSGAPCKHQGAVLVKYHISIFNFIPSFVPDDRMIYTYIALGYIAKEKSLYASLYAQPQQSHAEMGTNNALITNNTYINEGSKESSERDEEIDMSKFASFLEVVKLDYQNSGPTLQIALNKFKDHYNAAKSKSIP